MFVSGVREMEVQSTADALAAVSRGARNRHVATTNLNDMSSRSHSICTLRLVRSSPSSDQIIISQLSLVDLAGSERNHRTQARGLRQREAGEINQSLMTLRQCFEVISSPIM